MLYENWLVTILLSRDINLIYGWVSQMTNRPRYGRFRTWLLGQVLLA
jgi:Na+/melibiose symporter-like transporter